MDEPQNADGEEVGIVGIDSRACGGEPADASSATGTDHHLSCQQIPPEDRQKKILFSLFCLPTAMSKSSTRPKGSRILDSLYAEREGGLFTRLNRLSRFIYSRTPS